MEVPKSLLHMWTAWPLEKNLPPEEEEQGQCQKGRPEPVVCLLSEVGTGTDEAWNRRTSLCGIHHTPHTP